VTGRIAGHDNRVRLEFQSSLRRPGAWAALAEELNDRTRPGYVRNEVSGQASEFHDLLACGGQGRASHQMRSFLHADGNFSDQVAFGLTAHPMGKFSTGTPIVFGPTSLMEFAPPPEASVKAKAAGSWRSA
jgi:hypothetical protein